MVNPQKIYNDLIDYLKHLSPDEWSLIVYGKWTVKDIICHLIGWNKMAIIELPKVWKSGETPWFMVTDNYDEFNQKFVAKLRNYSGKEILEMFQTSENEFNKVISAIGDTNLRSQGEKYNWVFDEDDDNHYLEHYLQIKEAVQNFRFNH